ncbi:MAG: hypothetical protein R3178_01045, partial [Rhodothermales bacterium]|nr:hypothetical protein [Rhodothermales bacterium]
VLAVVDATHQHGFDRLCEDMSESSDAESAGGTWTRRDMEEKTAACYERDDATVVVLQGRQLRTAENLEVLAIGTDADLDDGLPIRATLDAATAAGAVRVIPWGFGKWFGRRGRVLRNLLDESDPTDFFLGDNSNRLSGAHRPALFAEAEALGFRMLPGSDPLPFPDECQSVGRAGFVLPGRLDLDTPASDLKRRLSEVGATIEPFGEFESTSRFLRNQLNMQRSRLLRRSTI